MTSSVINNANNDNNITKKIKMINDKWHLVQVYSGLGRAHFTLAFRSKSSSEFS